MDQLSDAQLQKFDTEYVTDERWAPIKRGLDTDFPDGKFSFVDLGGGNGVFADRVLASYPLARGTVVDSSELLLGRNTDSPRKTTVLADATNFGATEGFDVVFCNWLLHHLVTTGSYKRSRRNIAVMLSRCHSLLNPGGRLSIYENNYNGFIDGFPGRAIFELTSSAIMAGLVKKLGANTAGVGVCFLSHRQWMKAFEHRFAVNAHTPDFLWRHSLSKRVCLLIRSARASHYWLQPL